MIRIEQSKRGVVLIWVVLLFLILVGLVGLALDTALIVLTSQQLQIGADAAALAGAAQVRIDQAQARTQAVNLGGVNKAAGSMIKLDRNDSNDSTGDIVLGRFDRTTQSFISPTTLSPNAVKVVARRTGGSLNSSLPLLFGPIFGVNHANLQATAIAMVGGGTGSGIIALNRHADDSLYVKGNATVQVNNASIQVNSDSASGAHFQGKFVVDATALNVVGDYSTTGGGELPPTMPINTDASVVEDPLGYLPEPAEPSLATTPATTPGTVSLQGGTMNLLPGAYPGGISATGGTLNFSPGIYYVGGIGLDLRGNVNAYGEGVMFFLDEGCVNINGTGTITLAPPDPEKNSYTGSETYEGVLFFQSRDNATTSKINGTSGLDLTGTLYFPDSIIELSGTSDKVGTQIIADQLHIGGNGFLTINYDGEVAAPGNHVFLVI